MPVSLRLRAAIVHKTNLDVSVRVPPKLNKTCSRILGETLQRRPVACQPPAEIGDYSQDEFGQYKTGNSYTIKISIGEAMKKYPIYVAFLLLAVATNSWATPSRQVWIPSTDTQPMGTFNLGMDTYTTMFRKADKGAHDTPTNYGITAGFALAPIEQQLNVEVGIDLREPTDYPLLFNAKVALPEGAWFPHMPALAVGIYDFGTEKNKTNYNIAYGLLAKTIPGLGRVTGGYYDGNGGLLKDGQGRSEDDGGVLLSWDRVMREFSERLWAGVDYQSGYNKYGALSFGISWAFTDSASVVLGYQVYNDSDLMGKDTVTIQFDLDF